MKSNSKSTPAIAFIALVAVAVACSDSAATVLSPLEGLARITAGDTASNTPPPPATGPGSFHGVVKGYTSGFGDTAVTAQGLEGVKVTAYTRVAPTATDSVGVGPEAASVTTDATGAFQLPVLPFADYIVTFTVPAGSKYRSGWTVSTASATSNESGWWIMLQEK